MNNLVIIGTVGLDDVTTYSGIKENNLGGSCSYVSVAASHFTNSKIIGIVGTDFPKEYINLFENKKINIEHLEVVEGKTFRWKARYDDLNVAETLDTQLNVFSNFKPVLNDQAKNDEFFFLGNLDPKIQLDVLAQMNNIKLVGMDTMNFWINDYKEDLLKVIEKVDILFVNEDEVRSLTGEENIFKAADKVLDFGTKYVVVKKGENGAFIYGNNFLFFTPIFPVKDVVDPTGAGDCFAGGFMGYLASINSCNEKDFKKAMIYGTVLSSFNIESFSLDKITNVSNAEIEKRKNKIHESVNFRK